VAALAAAGQGEDAAKLDDKDLREIASHRAATALQHDAGGSRVAREIVRHFLFGFARQTRTLGGEFDRQVVPPENRSPSTGRARRPPAGFPTPSHEVPMMLPRRTPHGGAGSFRPALETLEDRLVLSNAAYTSVLGQLNSTISNSLTTCIRLVEQFDGDVAAFNQNPHDFNALTNLVVDGLQLQVASAQLQQQTSLFANAVKVGEAFGLVTGSEVSLFDTVATDAVWRSMRYQNLANGAQGDLFAALLAFDADATPQLQPLPGTQPSPSPSRSPSPSPTPTGSVTENPSAPPATWPSDAKSGPPCSVTVMNPTNTP
jgi:hypothetical protein